MKNHWLERHDQNVEFYFHDWWITFRKSRIQLAPSSSEGIWIVSRDSELARWAGKNAKSKQWLSLATVISVWRKEKKVSHYMLGDMQIFECDNEFTNGNDGVMYCSQTIMRVTFKHPTTCRYFTIH